MTEETEERAVNVNPQNILALSEQQPVSGSKQ
jgi:hypothetical protein